MHSQLVEYESAIRYLMEAKAVIAVVEAEGHCTTELITTSKLLWVTGIYIEVCTC